jgi:hypothetical protein
VSTTGAGKGAGGRVKLYFFSYFNISIYAEAYNVTNLTVTVASGNDDEYNGTIFSTPCLPGYFGILCEPCKVGTYKIDISNILCSPCETIPEVTEPENANYTKTAWDTPLCPYACSPNLAPYSDNPDCLDSFMLFLDNLGGL